jgi:hypothetical protein
MPRVQIIFAELTSFPWDLDGKVIFARMDRVANSLNSGPSYPQVIGFPL